MRISNQMCEDDSVDRIYEERHEITSYEDGYQDVESEWNEAFPEPTEDELDEMAEEYESRVRYDQGLSL